MTVPAKRPAPNMKERDLQHWVIQIATQFGWRCWHVPAPMRADRKGGFVGAKEAAGLPDLILIHDDPPRLVFAELKGTGGKLSVEQQEFLKAARNVAVYAHSVYAYAWQDPARDYSPIIGVYAWTPDDRDLIEQILRTRILL